MLKPLQQNIINGEVLKQYNNLKLDQHISSDTSNVNKFPTFVPMPHPEKVFAEPVNINAIQEQDSLDQRNRVYYKFTNPDNKIFIQVRPNSQPNSIKHHFINIDDVHLKASDQQFKFELDQNILPFDQSKNFKSEVMTSSLASEFEQHCDPNGLHLVWGGNQRYNPNLNLENRPISTLNGHTELKTHGLKNLQMYHHNDPNQNKSNLIYQKSNDAHIITSNIIDFIKLEKII